MKKLIYEFVSDHEFLGYEYDWAAIDENGYIGYFSTAGSGPVPQLSTQEPTLFDGLFEKIASMDVVSDSIQMNGSDRNVSDWILIAQRGVFSFDWRQEISLYQIIATPKNPVRLEILDTTLQSLLGRIKIECDFERKVGIEDLIRFI